MRGDKRKTFAWISITAVLVWYGSRAVLSDDGIPKNAARPDPENRDWVATVKAKDLGRGVQVIGNLGHPLGHPLTVRGAWQKEIPETKAGPAFIVTRVNGSDLAEPVYIRRNVLTALDKDVAMPVTPGGAWELRGYERCGMKGVPVAAFVEQDQPVPSQPFGFGFVTEFEYFRSVKIK